MFNEDRGSRPSSAGGGKNQRGESCTVNFPDALLVLMTFFLLVLSVNFGYGHVLVKECMRVENPNIKECTLMVVAAPKAICPDVYVGLLR